MESKVRDMDERIRERFSERSIQGPRDLSSFLNEPGVFPKDRVEMRVVNGFTEGVRILLLLSLTLCFYVFDFVCSRNRTQVLLLGERANHSVIPGIFFRDGTGALAVIWMA